MARPAFVAAALALTGASAWAPARPQALSQSRVTTSAPLRAEKEEVEVDLEDLSLEAMFEVFDAADPEGVAAREAEEKAAAEAAKASAAKMEMALEGVSRPLGFWDPLELSTIGTEAETLAWFRHAELKHSRVAMAATTGWIINEAGITFPGDISTGQSFASLGKGWDAWANVPDLGKVQILFVMGCIELASEAKQPHYMKGGRPGQTDGPLGLRFWDPLGLTAGYDAETIMVKRQRELNNGRLAMIGVASFVSASFIDGSVPALPDSW